MLVGAHCLTRPYIIFFLKGNTHKLNKSDFLGEK